MKNNVLRAGIILVMALTLIAGEGCAQSDGYKSIEDSVPTITVRGTASIETTPDETIAGFGVESEEKLLAEAYEKNTDMMNSVISAVKGLGIQSKDIKTSSYIVNPVYPKDEKGRRIPGSPVAFRVSQKITVKIRDVSQVGVLIDRVLSRGINVFTGIQFGSSKMEKLEDDARAKAAENARQKALLMTESLGVELGRVLRVTEPSGRPYPLKSARAYEAVSAVSAPQIEAGTMEVTADCEVVYEIRQ